MNNKLTEIKDCLEVLNNPEGYTVATTCMAEDELQSYGAEWLNYLLSLIEEKDKANEELRSAAWAAEKYINGTAILFSHRTKEAVLSRLDKALEPYRINDDTSSNNKGEI